jgi:hypothetical protein
MPKFGSGSYSSYPGWVYADHRLEGGSSDDINWVFVLSMMCCCVQVATLDASTCQAQSFWT